MSCGPQCFERKTSILEPAVFAVLIKMNLYLWDRIIEEWGAGIPPHAEQLADATGFRQAAENKQVRQGAIRHHGGLVACAPLNSRDPIRHDRFSSVRP